MFRHFLHSLSSKKTATNSITLPVDDEKLENLIIELMNSPELTPEELGKLNEAEKQRLAVLIAKSHAAKTDSINAIDKKLTSTNWAQGIVTKAAMNGSANAILAMSPQLFAAETEASIDRKKDLEKHRICLSALLQTVNENIAITTGAKGSPRSSPRRLMGSSNSQ